MVCGILVHPNNSDTTHCNGKYEVLTLNVSKIEFHGSSAVQLELKLWYIPKITVNSLVRL